MSRRPEREITARISVERRSPGVYGVVVDDGAGQTRHTVRLGEADWRRLTGGAVGEKQLIVLSFQFLLEREPKESILPEFELSVISRYFPEYEQALRRRIVR